MQKSVSDIIDFFTSRNVQAKDSRGLETARKHAHLIIKGKERTVNYYPNTGTIYCEPVKNKFKPYKLKNTNQDRALERILSLANFGY